VVGVSRFETVEMAKVNEAVALEMPSIANSSGRDAPQSSTRPFRDEYADKMRRDAAMMAPGSFPQVEIRYNNLRYELQLPQKKVDRKIHTVPEAFLGVLKSPFTLAQKAYERASGVTTSTSPFVVLDDITGVLKAGSVSL
jgi:hypothetical protein